MAGALLSRIFGAGPEEGANEPAGGIWSIVAANSELSFPQKTNSKMKYKVFHDPLASAALCTGLRI
jgi:hypothetical protein